jgi:Protein of unknown function (DUF1364)
MDLRKLARGKDCVFRFPTICNRDPATVVLCHIKRGWCGSLKPPDICAVYGCSNCHDVVDGRNTHHGWTRQEVDSMILRALIEQLSDYSLKGIVKW